MKKTLLVTNYVGINATREYLRSEGLENTVDIFQLQKPDALLRKIADNKYELVIIDGNLGTLYTKELNEKVLEKCTRKSAELCCANLNLRMKDMIFLGYKYADHIKGHGVFHRAAAA